MTKAVFRKVNGTLVPVDDEGRALVDKLKLGKDVVIEVKQARWPAHHRLLFAMLKFITEHTDKFSGTEDALFALKVATGNVDPWIDPDSGKTFFIPRSISWESMDQTAFSAFFDRAVYVISARWMPEGTTPDAVRTEIEAMCAPVGAQPR